MREERDNARANAADFANRCDDVRQSQLKNSVTAEGSIRTLESQLRIERLEKRDMEIKLNDAERKVRELEEKVISLSTSRNKADDYLNSLGKSGHTLRMEKAKNKELQTQNEMIQKALAIMETSLSAVKNDKELLISENKHLRTQLIAKDIPAPGR